jgi:RNA polymerase sigma factor for flagellar operon FliA
MEKIIPEKLTPRLKSHEEQMDKDELYLRKMLCRGARPLQKTKERIFRSHARIIYTWFRKISPTLPPFVDRAELMNAGVIGLLQAVDRFDPGKVTKLRTYADLRIRGAMFDYLRWSYKGNSASRRNIPTIEKARREVEQRVGRRADASEVADALGITLCEYTELYDQIHVKEISVGEFPDYPEEPTASDRLHKCKLQELVNESLSTLTDKERSILASYYWGNLTWLDITEKLNITMSELLDLRDSAYRKVREQVGSLNPRFDF